MPLEEISGNVRRSTSIARGKALHHDSPSSLAVPPSAVQGMLKTTTELGDLGRFGTGSSRLPRSGSRVQLTRARSGSFDTSFASALRHNRSPHVRDPGRQFAPRPPPSSSTLSARQLSRSNVSTYAPPGSSRRRRHGHHQDQVHGARGPQPSLYTHRSLVTLRSNRDGYSIRSMSPDGPPGYPQRVPRRAVSPAYTENRSLRTPQLGFGRAPSTGTVASSDTSAFPPYRVPAFRPNANASYTSLQHFPSPLPPQRFRHDPFSPIARTATPSSVASHHGGPFRGSTASLGGIPQSPTGSTAPAYYDYSESFVEETCFSPDGELEDQDPPLAMDRRILQREPTPLPSRHAQTPFGTRQGSRFRPIELPTRHNRRPSEQSKHVPGSRLGDKPASRHSAKRSPSGRLPEGVCSIGPTIAEGPTESKSGARRTRSEDTAPGAIPTTDLARKPTIFRHSLTTSPSTGFFSSASRSGRDLASLAARVHSPQPGIEQHSPEHDSISIGKQVTPTDDAIQRTLIEGKKINASKTEWQLPAFTFRPISFLSNSSRSSIRPRTSEADSRRATLEVHSPVPKRPASSQSRRRFSKILDVDEHYAPVVHRPRSKPLPIAKHHVLKAVTEVVESSVSDRKRAVIPSPVSSTASLRQPNFDFNDNEHRISSVTSHDKSTVESLLDRHIECLGLQPVDLPSHASETHDVLVDERQTSTDESTLRLTEILAALPPRQRGRPTTSTSQQYSSLATLDRRAMRPRRLFASMDARVPNTLVEQSPPISPVGDASACSRRSYGWQTLPSDSVLGNSSSVVPTITSGELADVDTSDAKPKLRVKRRSLRANSVSGGSEVPLGSSNVLGKIKTDGHKRSKTDILIRQMSHSRRKMRIRLKLRTKSQTTGDLLAAACILPTEERAGADRSRIVEPMDDEPRPPVTGYAELSGDSVPISQTNIAARMSKSPPIPTRWSSIIAAMPQPIKRSAEIARKASQRSHRSQRSNNSVVEPLNSTRIHKPIPRMNSIPRLGSPDLGPPLTSSDFNLSIPYAEIPSTIRPTLRETTSFFSDDSSAKRQRRSLRQKLHIHSLRTVMSGSAETDLLSPSPRFNGITLSHSCQLKGRKFDGMVDAPGDTVPMTDFAYQRRKVVERFKDWWNKQCLQKVVHGRKRRERALPGAMVW